MERDCVKCGIKLCMPLQEYNVETNMLDLRCGRCGYEWAEPPCDGTPSPPTHKEKWERVRGDIGATILLVVIFLFAAYGIYSLVRLIPIA